MDAVEHPLTFVPDAGRAAFGTVQHRELELGALGQPSLLPSDPPPAPKHRLK